ncbi:MAG: HAD-IC family P-type ATPase [Clostridia bacterium]|nr:HAD-IC family P-type ATPase [Clostridia bacterium]
MAKNEKQTKNKKKMAVPLAKAERYDSIAERGLSQGQVDLRIEDGLTNYLDKKTGKSYLQIFLTNIFTFFNLIYFVIFIALAYYGLWNQVLFMIVLVLNTGIAIIQECKSKKTIEKLSIVSAPMATVIRDGKEQDISVDDVVLDDIMVLSLGKQICADSIVVSGQAEVNESMLTGESVPVAKRKGDVVYAGSYVTSGSCVVRVDKIGEHNYIQNLTLKAKKYQKPRSELLKALRSVLVFIAIIIVPITILSLKNNYSNAPLDVNPIAFAISKTAGSIIPMIPAGAFLLTSATLAVSVIRLAKRNTLVQELYCIEMLARVNVLCLDKTGTITDGTMTVEEIIEIKNDNTKTIKQIVGNMMRALDDNNMTSIALREKFGSAKGMAVTATVPFSSDRKFSAVSFEGEGTYFLGAPEFVLPNGNVKVDKLVQKYAEQGYRVLVLANSASQILKHDTDEPKLPAVRRPVALIVIEDRIRPDAPETIQWFKDNNVEVKVISGDNPITVSEIARKVGIEDSDKFISLEGMSDEQVAEAANKYTVFGRVTPDQKAILVKALRKVKKTVGMTGDGVNDILAMREADCSIAMAAGSEAARNVAHLVLVDNNFASMPRVVAEGRRVVNNVQSVTSLFFMKTIYTIVLTILALALNITYPYSTNSIILMETCIVGFGSVMLAFQPNTSLIHGKFLPKVLKKALPNSLVFIATTSIVYMIAMAFIPVEQAQLETIAALSYTVAVYYALVFNCKPFNVYRVIVLLLAGAMTIVGVFALGWFFGYVSLSYVEVLILVCVAQFAYPLMSLLTRLFNKIEIK